MVGAGQFLEIKFDLIEKCNGVAHDSLDSERLASIREADQSFSHGSSRVWAWAKTVKFLYGFFRRIPARVGRTATLPTTGMSKRTSESWPAPDRSKPKVSVRQFRFNSADFLKLGVSNAFVIDETNRNLR
jgi:hypothetical protein